MGTSEGGDRFIPTPSPTQDDIEHVVRYHPLVKQLLLRVPDDLHRRLTERASREGRSVNALATEVLQVAATVDPGSRQDRLRMRSAALGWSSPHVAYLPGASTDSERRAAVAAMSGLGPVIDQILDQVRHR